MQRAAVDSNFRCRSRVEITNFHAQTLNGRSIREQISRTVLTALLIAGLSDDHRQSSDAWSPRDRRAYREPDT
jgi:hypothetical protein